VLKAAFKSNGRRIVTTSEDKTARLWDVATGKPIGQLLRGHENYLVTAAIF
jgi:WD40 repeat protein